MNKIFTDKNMVKFNKLPTFVWWLILGAAIFFANASIFLDDTKSIVNYMSEAYGQMGVNINGAGMSVIITVFSVFVSVLIFELIAKWLAYPLIRHFFINIGIKELVLQIRLVLIIAKTFIGFIGIVRFFYVDIGNLLYGIFEFAIIALLYGLYYEAVRKKYVPEKFQSALFVYVARIFIGIFLIFSAYDFIYSLVIMDMNLNILQKLTLVFDLIIKIGFAVGAYFYNRSIKSKIVDNYNPNQKNNGYYNINVDSSNVDNNIKEEPKEEKKKEDDKVFKDFDL